MNRITTHILPNGLRIVHLLSPHAPVAHFGIAVGAGSADETSSDEYGLAHFVEHTLFKGTKRRRAWHIANRMEAVGGELNAFTTKEDTVVYTVGPKGSLTRALDLITDILLDSQFPASEIEKEREVVCDEINSYLDSPADAVYDDFEDMLYDGTPLGHNILGTVGSVRSLTSAHCRRWLDRHYRADNMVAFYSGCLSVESFLRKASPYLETLPSAMEPEGCMTMAATSRQFDAIRHTPVRQAHTVAGCAMSRPDTQRRAALALLTNIVGGPGMNSLFNQTMRERRGLVYAVESTLTDWRRSTMFTTYFGCDSEDTPLCISLVRRGLESLADKAMNPRKLSSAKKQYLGQMSIAMANNENRILGLARSMLLHRHFLTPEQTAALINSLTAEDLRAAAESLLPLSTLTFTHNNING